MTNALELVMAHDNCCQHFYISSVLQSPVAVLFGLRSSSAGSLLQEMMNTSTARGQTVRSYLVNFTHFIAGKIVSQTSNLTNLMHNVHTAYVIFLSHFHGFSLM